MFMQTFMDMKYLIIGHMNLINQVRETLSTLKHKGKRYSIKDLNQHNPGMQQQKHGISKLISPLSIGHKLSQNIHMDTQDILIYPDIKSIYRP